MRDVFISHTEEDAPLALALARGLNAAGYSTWCYEDDSDPGPSYLSQIDEELEGTQAVVLIVSATALVSPQVVKEVVRAHEAGKPFIPLRRGIGHEAIQQVRDFRMALGASVSIALPDDGVESILPRVIRGLERSGVRPGGAPPALPLERVNVPLVRPAPPSATALWRTAGHRIAGVVDKASDATRLAITTVVAILGVIGSLANVAGVLNATGETAYLYRQVPAIGTANLWANVAGLALNGALLFSAWQWYRRYDVGERIRLITGLMLITIAVWLIVVVMSALFPPDARLRGNERAAVVGNALVFALVGGVPAALVRNFFRRRQA